MNLWTDSGRKCALETESKFEIERKHLNHKDISNLVNYNTTYKVPKTLISKVQSVQSE